MLLVDIKNTHTIWDIYSIEKIILLLTTANHFGIQVRNSNLKVLFFTTLLRQKPANRQKIIEYI